MCDAFLEFLAENFLMKDPGIPADRLEYHFNRISFQDGSAVHELRCKVKKQQEYLAKTSE